MGLDDDLLDFSKKKKKKKKTTFDMTEMENALPVSLLFEAVTRRAFFSCPRGGCPPLPQFLTVLHNFHHFGDKRALYSFVWMSVKDEGRFQGEFSAVGILNRCCTELELLIGNS